MRLVFFKSFWSMRTTGNAGERGLNVNIKLVIQNSLLTYSYMSFMKSVNRQFHFK